MKLPDRLLTDRVNVTRPKTEFISGTKSPKTSAVPEVIATDLKCHIQPFDVEEKNSILGQFPLTTHWMFWVDVELHSNDRVEWGTEHLLITKVSKFPNHYECYLEQLR